MDEQRETRVAYVRQVTDIGTDPIPFELVPADDINPDVSTEPEQTLVTVTYAKKDGESRRDRRRRERRRRNY